MKHLVEAGTTDSLFGRPAHRHGHQSPTNLYGEHKTETKTSKEFSLVPRNNSLPFQLTSPPSFCPLELNKHLSPHPQRNTHAYILALPPSAHTAPIHPPQNEYPPALPLGDPSSRLPLAPPQHTSPVTSHPPPSTAATMA